MTWIILCLCQVKVNWFLGFYLVLFHFIFTFTWSILKLHYNYIIRKITNPYSLEFTFYVSVAAYIPMRWTFTFKCRRASFVSLYSKLNFLISYGLAAVSKHCLIVSDLLCTNFEPAKIDKFKVRINRRYENHDNR